jgi:hypothetical protein
MNLAITDYNGSEKVLANAAKQEWKELADILQKLPLCLKPSDQAGKQGEPIFDPVATNAFIQKMLNETKGWGTGIPIPEQYRFLGLDIDAGKNGVLVEVQFSNYPFLLNNMLRAEMFFQGKLNVGGRATGVAIMVTKGLMFPASNSTLYYEQAQKQLEALAKTVFRVPLRLVGLMSPVEDGVPALWTTAGARYSRDLSGQRKIRCDIKEGTGGRRRISVKL